MNQEVLHVFRVDDGESHWFVAATKDEALAEYRRLFHDTVDEEDRPEVESVTQEPDDKVLKVVDEDPDPQLGSLRAMTCAEWVAEKGRKFWCTTCC